MGSLWSFQQAQLVAATPHLQVSHPVALIEVEARDQAVHVLEYLLGS